MKNILITGGTGFIGKALTSELLLKGYKVAHLTRKQSATAVKSFVWDIAKKTIDYEAIKWADVIVHLAGEGIADKRWTKKRKKEIIDSRVEGINLIGQAIQRNKKNLQVFISASGIGYYGAITSEKIFSEDNAAGTDFLAQVCLLWEQAVDELGHTGMRTAKIRTAAVLGKQGGVLEKIVPLFKSGLGSAFGSGKQFMPWIHLDDLCAIYIKAIEDKTMNGVYNAVAPESINNKSFHQTIASKLNKPFFLPPFPKWLFKLLLGERSILLLEGSRISCDKILKTGFTFKFPHLKTALDDLL